jgi:outer membrane assembly lipoprotein YfiO
VSGEADPELSGQSNDGTPKTHTDSILEKLTYPELTERRKQYLESGNKDMILKYTERMVKLCDEPKELAELMLEVGDLYFEKGYLTEAEQYYSEFSLIFQGSEKAEYALYQSIQCSFRRTLDIDRDQTKTEETIAMADKFLARPSFKNHTKEVEQIRTACYKKLVEREIYVCEFYIKKGSLRASERRLDTIKSEWLPKLPEYTTRVVELETAVTDLRTKKGVTVPTVTTVVAEAAELPKDENVQVAAAPGKHMSDRF